MTAQQGIDDHLSVAEGETVLIFGASGAVGTLAVGPALERCLDLMNPGGRVAYPDGVEPEPQRRKGIRIVAYDGVAGRPDWAALERAVEEARLRVPIGGVYPLEQAAMAHAQVERGHVLGRIVLRTREES